MSDGPGDHLALSRDEWGRLTLVTPEGRTHVGVEPVRAFPISDPDRFLSFVDADGLEVFCLHDLATLPAASAALLREEIAAREFLPVIERIEKVSAEGTPSDWDVVTDRGRTTFTLESDEDVRRIGPQRVFLSDSRKLRYQIPDVRALDFPSRRLLERYL